MAGITGMGTTFSLPNYTGELFGLTPDDTPFLSAIGGLTGGGMTTSTEFEWQTSDLRDPGQRVRTEGATAPTAEERVRANVTNVVQIHQEKVSLSYTKQAATGQLASPQSAPFNHPGGGPNPITSEMDWQVLQTIKSMKLDANWSLLNGQYVRPNTNATARQTKGLLAAIQTNRISRGTSITGASSATDTVTSTGHGLVDGDKVVFTATGATPLVAGRVYFVDQLDANTFKLSGSLGGAAITLGTASGLAFTKSWTTTLTTDHIGELLQLAYDNGGISEQATAAMLCNSIQKRAITKAFADAYGKFTESSRTIGGVNVMTLVTDFGTLNVMMDRHMPQDALAAVSLEQCMPVLLNVPGKGVFFEEPLGKTGASDDVQIYGEIGLKWGNERAHALMTGLKL